MSRVVKAQRARVPRSSFGRWKPAADRPNPIDVLREQERTRIPALLPIRHGRMLESPFAFYRGAAAIMAYDLAHSETTGLRVQLCGDAHLANFGAYATPERRLVFDVNDFDETLSGPWEWDVLRLCASIPLAGRSHRMRTSTCDAAIDAAARSYREALRIYGRMAPLDVWYSRVNAKALLKAEEMTMAASADRLLPKFTQNNGTAPRFVDRPPLFRRLDDETQALAARGILRNYRSSLPLHVRTLIDRYHLVDLAMKIVGVGSVGTHCLVALLLAEDDQPLLLQLKEAQASVFEPYLHHSPFANHGERVVIGQRVMQAASDIFLGWTNFDGCDYYVRQLRDMKATLDLDAIAPEHFIDYCSQCGRTLARAHARSGEPAAIAAYLGQSDTFIEAMRRFACAYAAQTETDYEAFLADAKNGALGATEATVDRNP